MAAKDMFNQTSIQDLSGLFEEFEKRECLEAKVVKDADNIDIDFELKELEERGSRMNVKWHKNRILVREEKLYTETAKAI